MTARKLGARDSPITPDASEGNCPILALNGAKDGQLLPGQNLPAISAATLASPGVTLVEQPGRNPLFQTAKTGAVGEYADIEETVAPTALDTMTVWIRKHVTRARNVRRRIRPNLGRSRL